MNDTASHIQHRGAVTDIDVTALERRLKQSVKGEVRFDDGSRALYATDGSNYRQTPIGVVIPRDQDDVVAAVAICREFGAPLLSRGGGTSLCGQCCNVAVVLDFSKYMNKILEIDTASQTARVQPGVVLDRLRDAAKKQGLTFAPDPATHNHNTLGGMIGNNSCGPHSVMGGETVHNVVELDILTYDGLRMTVGATSEAQFEALCALPDRRADIVRRLKTLGERHASAIREVFPQIPRRVSGFNLPQLLPENGFNLARALVGTEGTCVVVLEARLRLLPWPKETVLVVLGYPSVYEAADHVPQIMQHGPQALEGFDDRLLSDMEKSHLHTQDIGLVPEGRGWLLVEFGAMTREEAHRKAQDMLDAIGRSKDAPSSRLVDDPDMQSRFWEVRESGLGATSHVPHSHLVWAGWEDSSVPPERLGDYLRKFRKLVEDYGYHCDLYGHFGQGCVHTRLDFDLRSAEGIAKYRRFVEQAARLVVGCGGSISGEHGDGQSKGELLPIMYGQELVAAFSEFKGIWDPEGKMNPGKVVDPNPLDSQLRLGTAYRPMQVESPMHFVQDRHDFANALLRCVGVGKCRKTEGGTMCPSYMATMEEMHSTRGRAHLLWEMVNANREDSALRRGWREPAVKEALDLCLSCKGCKGECPVKVDMASYKAEFLYHYFQEERRPMRAYAFGRIDQWARWGSLAPGLVNFFTQNPLTAGIGKRLMGLARERDIPPLPRRTFRQGFQRQRHLPGTRELLLWPDTFNNHFHPEVAHAAVDVLRNAGWKVKLPPVGLCCGRPLYEFGMLDEARIYLKRITDALTGALRAGTPIVVLEPSCMSVFQEEMPMMLPRDQNAKRLQQQVKLLPDFLQEHAPDFPFEALNRPALVHGHCHHKAVLEFSAETQLLEDRLKLDLQVPDDGCCGMAGSFGFEAEKYEVSITCGERRLLPAVRAWPEDELLIADGYSCREQVWQCTGRLPLHTAQVLQMALPGR